MKTRSGVRVCETNLRRDWGIPGYYPRLFAKKEKLQCKDHMLIPALYQSWSISIHWRNICERAGGLKTLPPLTKENLGTNTGFPLQRETTAILQLHSPSLRVCEVISLDHYRSKILIEDMVRRLQKISPAGGLLIKWALCTVLLPACPLGGFVVRFLNIDFGECRRIASKPPRRNRIQKRCQTTGGGQLGLLCMDQIYVSFLSYPSFSFNRYMSISRYRL